MPEGKPPVLSAEDQARLDTMLEDPNFQRYADTLMDMEFGREGLCDFTPDLETNRHQLAHVRIMMHNEAINRLEPGEHFVTAYRIARECVADELQQAVLQFELNRREAGSAARVG